MQLAARRSLDNGSVADLYARLASVYDWIFATPLQPGRAAAIRCLSLQPGDSVLEVGIGTGLGASLYPAFCRVTGIDLSETMLKHAAHRLERAGIDHVRLMQMDAARLEFDDETFDAVYAPYVITTAADPVGVAREMRRVCRRDGRIVFVNHFLSRSRALSWIERRLAAVCLRLGFASDLDLYPFLQGAELEPLTVQATNWPPLWTVVACRSAQRRR